MRINRERGILKLRRTVCLLLILALLAFGPGAGLAEQVLQLPGTLKVVTEEAFSGLSAIQRVTLPEGVEEIQRRAFAGSGVTEINLPSSLKSIADDAFADTPLAKVSATEGTYAYNWAVAHGYIAAAPGLSASVLTSSSAVKLGETVVWTVAPSGNTGDCRYTFKLYRDGALVVEEGRGTNNTFTHIPGTAGRYHVVCDVADDKTRISVEGGSVNVTTDALSGTIACDRTSALVGDTANWTVNASGGSGNYTYVYNLYRNNTRIFTSPAIDDKVLTFQFDKAATYYITCNLSDGSKTVTLTSEKIEVKKDESDAGLSIGVTTDAEALATAESQVWRVTPTGGKSPYRYSYTLKQGSTTVETQPYSADSSFGHTFFRPGSYTLNIKVKDNAGTVVSEDYPFSVAQGGTAVTGVVRVYVDTDSFGNIIENNSKTGHFELQLNNDSGNGIYFDNRHYDNPVFSFNSTGGGAIDVFGAEGISHPNAQLYTFSFATTAEKADQLLYTVLPSQYLNLNGEAFDGSAYVYKARMSYAIKSCNCFTSVAAWCDVLGYTWLSQIIRESDAYTDYIAWKMYNIYGAAWDYVGDF